MPPRIMHKQHGKFPGGFPNLLTLVLSGIAILLLSKLSRRICAPIFMVYQVLP